MSGERRDYLVVTTLPYQITMTFGLSGAPAESDLRPVFRRLGSDSCVARLPVKSWSRKQVVITLPESLAVYGEGRYELLLHQSCCRDCDKIEIWFEEDCEIVAIEGRDPQEYCHEC